MRVLFETNIRTSRRFWVRCIIIFFVDAFCGAVCVIGRFVGWVCEVFGFSLLPLRFFPRFVSMTRWGRLSLRFCHGSFAGPQVF